MGIFVGGQQIVGVGKSYAEIVAEMTTPPPPAVPGKVLGRAGGKALATVNAGGAATDQVSVCGSAARLTAAGNPSAGTVAALCAARRAENVAAGKFLADPFTPNDGAYRVALTNAGEAVVARSPALQSARAALPNASRARGFTMAQGVRAGLVDPAFVAFVTPGLAVDAELLKGFTDAIGAPGLTQSGNQGDDGGIPRNVLIAGGAVAVLAIAAVAFKLTRK